jgi:uncharacterized protein (UPF0297 family)
MDQVTIPIMSTTDMRSEVATWLNDLDDNFLAAVHAMVGTYVAKQEVDPIIGYTVSGEPKYASKMKETYDAEVRAAEEEGTFITLEELEVESAQW